MERLPTIGAIGFVVAFLGYRLIVRIGDSVRTSPLANAAYDSGYSGCVMVWLAWLMMLGGAGTFIYACIEYARQAS